MLPPPNSLKATSHHFPLTGSCHLSIRFDFPPADCCVKYVPFRQLCFFSTTAVSSSALQLSINSPFFLPAFKAFRENLSGCKGNFSLTLAVRISFTSGQFKQSRCVSLGMCCSRLGGCFTQGGENKKSKQIRRCLQIKATKLVERDNTVFRW